MISLRLLIIYCCIAICELGIKLRSSLTISVNYADKKERLGIADIKYETKSS